MTRRALLAVVLLAVAGGGLAFRLPQLARRPMHTDEVVHTAKFDVLWRTGRYVYDLKDFHGPTLYYATLPGVALAQPADYAATQEWHYRLVPVAFGVAVILLLALLADGLGIVPTLIAAVLTALSPAMVFYSRYYIQEMLLVCFTLAAIGCLWRYVCTRRAAWAVAAGVAVGLMQATKETCIIAFGAMAAAAAVTWVLQRWVPPRRFCRGASPEDRGCCQRAPIWRPAVLLLAVTAAVIVSVIFYSGTFTHAAGPADSLRAYFGYFQKAGEQGAHEHPWWYYLRELGWFRPVDGPPYTEAFVLVLAAIGVAAAFVPGATALPRFLAIYAMLMFVIYSAISYKTPWSILSALHAAILLAGLGAATLLRLARPAWLRTIVAAVLVAGAGHLAWQAYRANYVQFADGRNPYVYAHPTTDVYCLANKVHAVAGHSQRPSGAHVQVIVTGHDYWPLSWYLRDLKRVGYYDTPPEGPYGDVIVASADLMEALDARIYDTHPMVGYFQPRHGVWAVLYVRLGLWERYVQALPQQRKGGQP